MYWIGKHNSSFRNIGLAKWQCSDARAHTFVDCAEFGGNAGSRGQPRGKECDGIGAAFRGNVRGSIGAVLEAAPWQREAALRQWRRHCGSSLAMRGRSGAVVGK